MKKLIYISHVYIFIVFEYKKNILNTIYFLKLNKKIFLDNLFNN